MIRAYLSQKEVVFMKSIIQDMKHNYFINAVIMVILGIVLVIWPHILEIGRAHV